MKRRESATRDDGEVDEVSGEKDETNSDSNYADDSTQKHYKAETTKLKCSTPDSHPLALNGGLSVVELLKNKAFVEFVQENHINPEVYSLAGALPRYIRLNPKFPDVDRTTLEECFEGAVTPVPWLPGFYGLLAQETLVNKPLYNTGAVYGMDVSSGVAVAALDIRPGEHCLDLCCAPGGKLCMMADHAGSEGTATGVDISLHRLFTCQSIVKKYRHDNVRLYLNDGTTFDTIPPTLKGKDHACEVCQPAGPKKKRRKPKTAQEGLFYTPKAWQSMFCDKSNQLYDRVLVDAECTHDGSLKHLVKCKDMGWDKFVNEFFGDRERVEQIVSLQKRLLLNGIKMARPGGYVVYSTCSLTRAQNEGVILYALNTIHNIELVKIDLPNLPIVPGSDSEPARAGSESEKPDEDRRLKYVLRFNPIKSHTSGLFIAKFRKKCTEV
eukprot:CFRG2912T1